MNRNLLVLISLLFLSSQACIHKTQETTFHTVDVSELNNLVEFAINSNDVYKTRKASRKLAREVFELKPQQAQDGLIEKIIDKNGETLGFYSLKKPYKSENQKIEIELGHIFVKPGFMRQGIGTSLFKRAYKKAQTLNATRMHWISDPDAKNFYLKQGALLIGYDENLLNPNVDVPLFEVLLP